MIALTNRLASGHLLWAFRGGNSPLKAFCPPQNKKLPMLGNCFESSCNALFVKKRAFFLILIYFFLNIGETAAFRHSKCQMDSLLECLLSIIVRSYVS